jgi:hypothetical protein
MAPYQIPNPTDDPNYTSASKGTDAYKADESLGALFSGIGKTVGAGIDAADFFIKDKMQGDVYDAVDRIRKEFQITKATQLSENHIPPTSVKGEANPYGETTFTDPNAQPLSLIPGEGTPAKGRGIPPGALKPLNDIQKQYDAGQMSESFYNGRLNAEMSRIISTYGPGYRPDVEAEFKKITGRDPANALRESMIRDADATSKAAASASNRDLAFLYGHAEYGGTGYLEAVRQGNMSLREAVFRTGENVASHGKSKMVLQGLEVKSAMTKNVIDDSERAFIDHGNLTVNGIVSDMLKTNPQLMKTVDGWISGQPIEAKDMEQARLIFAGLRQKVQTATDNLYLGMDPEGKSVYKTDDGSSYSTWLTGTRGDAAKKTIMSRLDSMEGSLTNQHFGLFKSYMNETETLRDETTRRLFNDPRIRAWAAINKDAGGQAMINQLMQANWAGYQQTLKSYHNFMFPMTVGQPDGKPIPDQVNEFNRARGGDISAGDKAVLTKQMNADAFSVIKNDAVGPEIKRNTASRLYGPQADALINGGKYDANNWTQYYTQATDPALTASMKKLGGKSWLDYQNWAITSFPKVFEREMTSFQQRLDADPRFKGVFDPKTMTFSYQFKNEQAARETPMNLDAATPLNNPVIGNPNLGRQGANRGIVAFEKHIEEPKTAMNLVLGRLSDVIKASGRDPQVEMPSILAASGIKIQGVQGAKPSGAKQPEGGGTEYPGVGGLPSNALPYDLTPLPSVNVPAPAPAGDLKSFLNNPEGMPVYVQGRNAEKEIVSIRNTPETPVKQVTDRDGNNVWVTQRDGKWYKIVPVQGKR